MGRKKTKDYGVRTPFSSQEELIEYVTSHWGHTSDPMFGSCSKITIGKVVAFRGGTRA